MYILTSHSLQHFDALLSLLWLQYGEVFLTRRVAILDTWFTRSICNDYPRFIKSKKKKVWSWSSLLKNYVRGIVPGRYNKLG